MKLLSALIILVLLVASSFGSSPLVAQKTVVLEAEYATEVFRLETSKYKKLRIGVSIDKSYKPSGTELSVFALGIDGDNEFRLDSAKGVMSTSLVIDSPPTTTAIQIIGKGKFHIHVWAD